MDKKPLTTPVQSNVPAGRSIPASQQPASHSGQPATRKLVIARPQARQVFWLVIVVGALLRLSTLGLQSLWLDEGVSFFTVNRSFSSLLEMQTNAIRPLFFWVLYPAYLLGTDEWWLRLPSALAGILSLWMVYLLGRQLFERSTALLAAGLLALSPLHLWYSQEARFYALVGLFALSAVYFAVRAVKHNRLVDWLLFGLFEGLGLWTETASVWYILSINLAAVLLLRRLWVERRIFGWALAQAVGVALYLPRLATFANTVQGSDASWIPPATVRELLRAISDFSGGFMHAAWFGVLSILLVGLGMLVGLRWMVREAPRQWLSYAVLLPWLVVPITVNFIVSQPYFRPALMEAFLGSRPSIFLTRNMITLLFPLLILLARSLVLAYRQPQQMWQTASLALAGGLLALYALGYFSNHLVIRKEDYRSAGELVAEAARPGDLVLASPGYIEQPTAYYYYDEEPAENLSLASVRDGVVASDATRQDPAQLGQVAGDVENLVLAHQRVWLVTNDNIVQQPDPALLAYLDQQAELEQTIHFNGTWVRLYVLPGQEVSAP